MEQQATKRYVAQDVTSNWQEKRKNAVRSEPDRVLVLERSRVSEVGDPSVVGARLLEHACNGTDDLGNARQNVSADAQQCGEQKRVSNSGKWHMPAMGFVKFVVL